MTTHAHISVLLLRQDLVALRKLEPDMQIAMPKAPEDLEAIEIHLKRDPELARLIRPFLAVHLPSLQTALALVAKAQATNSIDAGSRAEIFSAFTRCNQLITDARKTLDGSLVRDLNLEISVLAQCAPALVVTNPPSAPAAGSAISILGSRVSGMLKNGSGMLVDGAADAAGWTKRTVVDTIVDGVSATYAAVTALPAYGMNWTKEGLVNLEAAVVDPVAVRVSAVQAGMWGAASNASLGLIIGIICPPLLPIASIDAVIGAIEGYEKGLADAQRLKGAEREAQIAKLQRERAQILADISGGAEVFQIDAGPINVTVDARSGELHRIVTRGPHSGRRLEELTHDDQEALLRAV